MSSPITQAVLDTQPVTVVDDVKEAAGVAAAAIDLTRKWISDRHNWVRLAWFTSGYAMIIVGVAILAKPAVDSAAASVGKITKGVI